MQKKIFEDMKEIEVLMAIGSYKSKSEEIKSYLRKLLGEYRSFIKPIDRVKEELAKEIPKEIEVSEEVIAMRREERH